MKKYKRILFFLHVLGLTAMAVLMALLPGEIPMHYNAMGEADRIGSKYEMLLFPLIAVIASTVFALAGRKKNGKVLLLTSAVLAGAVYALGIVFGAAALRSGHQVNVYRLTSVLVGVLIIVLGNAMPKAERNALFGLRTEWSMYNDEVWRKSQRYGGAAMMLAGAAMLLGALIFDGWINFIVMSAAVLAATIAGAKASKRFYDEEKAK